MSQIACSRSSLIASPPVVRSALASRPPALSRQAGGASPPLLLRGPAAATPPMGDRHSSLYCSGQRGRGGGDWITATAMAVSTWVFVDAPWVSPHFGTASAWVMVERSSYHEHLAATVFDVIRL